MFPRSGFGVKGHKMSGDSVTAPGWSPSPDKIEKTQPDDFYLTKSIHG